MEDKAEGQMEGIEHAPGRDARNNGKPAKDASGAPEEAAASTDEKSGNPTIDLQAELAQARAEIENLKDSWTRERAEFQNFRKRALQEKAKMKGYVISNFVHELLPVLDNLQLVLQTDNDHPEVARFIEGISMVEQVFLDALGKEKIKRFSPEGDAFNPMQMEAISVEEKADLEQESVLEVYQPGFMIEFDEGEAQVIRPARVKVGRPAASAQGNLTNSLE